MTNFEYLKEIINEDEPFLNFLDSFWENFCESVCPLNYDESLTCEGECKKGIFMWLIGNYDPKCPIWHIEE